MSTGYVSMAYGDDESSTQQVSDELKKAMDDMHTKIVAGDITVSTSKIIAVSADN